MLGINYLRGEYPIHCPVFEDFTMLDDDEIPMLGNDVYIKKNYERINRQYEIIKKINIEKNTINTNRDVLPGLCIYPVVPIGLRSRYTVSRRNAYNIRHSWNSLYSRFNFTSKNKYPLLQAVKKIINQRNSY